MTEFKSIKDMSFNEIEKELDSLRGKVRSKEIYEEKYRSLIDFIYSLDLYCVSKYDRSTNVTIAFNNRDMHIDEVMVGTVSFVYYKKELFAVNSFARLEDIEKMKGLYDPKVNKYLKK